MKPTNDPRSTTTLPTLLISTADYGGGKTYEFHTTRVLSPSGSPSISGDWHIVCGSDPWPGTRARSFQESVLRFVGKKWMDERMQWVDVTAKEAAEKLRTEHTEKEKREREAAKAIREANERDRAARAEIRNRFEKDATGFKKVKFQIALKDGSKASLAEAADGYARGGLVVCKLQEQSKYRVAIWTVSHQTSGMAVCHIDDGTLREAKAAAARLLEAGDWTRSAEEIAKDEKLRDLVLLMRKDPWATPSA